MIKYYINYSGNVEKREVLSETAHFVTYNSPFWRNTREAKGSRWFNTFEEAKQHLLDGYSNRLVSAYRDIEYLTDKIKNLKAWEEPCELSPNS